MNTFLSQYVAVVLTRHLAEQTALDRHRHRPSYGGRRRERTSNGVR